MMVFLLPGLSRLSVVRPGVVGRVAAQADIIKAQCTTTPWSGIRAVTPRQQTAPSLPETQRIAYARKALGVSFSARLPLTRSRL